MAVFIGVIFTLGFFWWKAAARAAVNGRLNQGVVHTCFAATIVHSILVFLPLLLLPFHVVSKDTGLPWFAHFTYLAVLILASPFFSFGARGFRPTNGKMILMTFALPLLLWNVFAFVCALTIDCVGLEGTQHWWKGGSVAIIIFYICITCIWCVCCCCKAATAEDKERTDIEPEDGQVLLAVTTNHKDGQVAPSPGPSSLHARPSSGFFGWWSAHDPTESAASTAPPVVIPASAPPSTKPSSRKAPQKRPVSNCASPYDYFDEPLTGPSEQIIQQMESLSLPCPCLRAEASIPAEFYNYCMLLLKAADQYLDAMSAAIAIQEGYSKAGWMCGVFFGGLVLQPLLAAITLDTEAVMTVTLCMDFRAMGKEKAAATHIIVFVTELLPSIFLQLDMIREIDNGSMAVCISLAVSILFAIKALTMSLFNLSLLQPTMTPSSEPDGANVVERTTYSPLPPTISEPAGAVVPVSRETVATRWWWDR